MQWTFVRVKTCLWNVTRLYHVCTTDIPAEKKNVQSVCVVQRNQKIMYRIYHD